MKKFNGMFFVSSFLLILLYSLNISAQVKEWEEKLKKDPENRKLLLNLGKYYHEIGGNNNNSDAVKKAEKYLSKLVEIDPKNAAALVYLGSALTICARDASSQDAQLEYVTKGFARMDKAVYFEPGNFEVRLIRGINSTYIPEMLGRLSVALKDFKHIEKLLNEKELKLEKETLQQYYFHYGLVLAKSGEKEAAKKIFIKTSRINPDSPLAKNAERELDNLKEQQK